MMHIQQIRFTMTRLPLSACKGNMKAYASDMRVGSNKNNFYNRPECLDT